MTQQDRRTHKRYEVDNLSGHLTFILDVKILNMSLDGMAIETNKLVTVNRDYSVKLECNDENIRLTGKVVWSTLARTAHLPNGDVVPIYRAGLKFEKVLSEKAHKINKFIEKNRVLKLEHRLYGRFKIDSKNATIHLPHDFTIKKISLSGMLIETDLPLEEHTTYDIAIQLREGEEIFPRVQVRNLLREESSNRYSIGVAFVNLSDNDRKKLEAYLKQLEEQAD